MTGKTTKQMLEAKPRAIYVWCNNHLTYPNLLAQHLGRNDLRIVTPGFVSCGSYRGYRVSQVVVDHALEPDQRFRDGLDDLLRCVG